ncbi:MAG: hypothetical protein A2284_14820 [Deltaproteobacteria bacterium RIFOXYA12_FULL_61_11]|nr:MAG: hypothetical protein A2284_14820 [Deltaproteobacteria bacterium RIFOXYA12_FULL_61_11]
MTHVLLAALFLAGLFPANLPALDTSLSADGSSGLLTVPGGYLLDRRELSFGIAAPMDAGGFNPGVRLALAPWSRLEASAAVSLLAEDDASTPNSQRTLRTVGLKLLLVEERSLLPTVVAGWQDLPLGPTERSRPYLALSKSFFGSTRLTAGWAFGPHLPGGPLLGLESTLRSKLTLLTEYQDRALGLGLRLSLFSTGPNRGEDLRSDLTLGLRSSQEMVLAWQLHFSNQRPLKSPDEPEVPLSELHLFSTSPVPADPHCAPLVALLERSGFEDVTVSKHRRGEEVVLAIAYENRIFFRNPGDGVRRVLELALAVVLEEGYLFLVIERRNRVPLFFLEARRGRLRSLLDGDESQLGAVRLGHGKVPSPGGKLLARAEGHRRSFLHADLVFAPILVHRLDRGDDFRAFGLDLGTRLDVPLWTGSLLETGLSFSGPRFFGLAEPAPRIRPTRMVLHQLLPPWGGALVVRHALGLGLQTEDLFGLGLQTLFSLPGAPYALVLDHRALTATDLARPRLHHLLGFHYRWRNLFLSTRGGTFLAGDRGGSLVLGAFLRALRTEVFATWTELDRLVGFTLTLPLTFRREPLEPCFLRPRLAEEFPLTMSTAPLVAGLDLQDPFALDHLLFRRGLDPVSLRQTLATP